MKKKISRILAVTLIAVQMQTVVFADMRSTNISAALKNKSDTVGIFELGIDNNYGNNVDYDKITDLPTITKDNKPLEKEITLNAGDVYNPLENVKAVDAKGRELEVKVDSDKELNLDPDNDTTYNLTYTAIDMYGNEAKEEVVINVIANKAPAIYANDKTIKQGREFNPLDGVTANDKEDGNLNSNILVEENTVNTSEVGSYKVTYSVSDSKGLKTTKTIEVNVSSDVVLAQNIKISNKFDKIYTKASNEVTATVSNDADNKDIVWSLSDNDIAKLEVKGSTAKIIGNKEGKITITASTVDGSDKSDSFQIEIVDFENESSIPKGLKDLIDLNVLTPVTGEGSEDLPVELEVKDVDVEDFRLFINDIKSLSPSILSSYEEDNFTIYKIKLTTISRLFKKSTDYYIDIKIDNSLKNAEEYKIILNKISNNAPEIISDGLKTTVKVGEKFDPLYGVIAVDKEDGDITSKIKVVGSVDTSKVGDYEITYEVEDKDGSKTTKIVIIKVIKDETTVLPEGPETPQVPGGTQKPSDPNTTVDSENKDVSGKREDTTEVSNEDSVVKDEETEEENKELLTYLGIGALLIGTASFLFQKN